MLPLPPPVRPRSHPITATLWLCLVIASTMNSHSGYDFGVGADPRGHDWHHEKFNECFGPLGILDWLHGTSSGFTAMKAQHRRGEKRSS